MSKLIAIAVPILEGKTEQWRKFVDEINTRYKKEYDEVRKKLGVYERVFLQTGPQGDYAIVTLEGSNPEEAFKHFGEKNSEFSRWFVDKIKEIHGFDLSDTENFPELPELVAESEPLEEHVEH